MCHRIQGDSVAKRQPLLCVVGVVGVVTSCVPCARGRISRSCATEKTYTPARQEALVKLSMVASLTKFSASCGVLSPTRHLVRHVLHLVRDLVAMFLLVVYSVAIHLFRANANLFLSL